MEDEKGLMVPQALIAPRKSEPDPSTGDKKRQIIMLARNLNQIGWGNMGSIEGMHEMVDILKVWPNPWHPSMHPTQEIIDMADSLLQKGQQEDVIVCYASDWRTVEEGNTGGVLMIEDGLLRYQAALRLGWDKIRVTVRPASNMTSVLLDWAARTFKRHTLRGFEIGRTFLLTQAAYKAESLSDSTIPKPPSQEEFATMVGRSQGTINQWMKLGAQPIEFLDLLNENDITETQAFSLIRIRDEVERLQQAQELAEANRQARTNGLPLPGRGHIRSRALLASGRQLFPDSYTMPNADLWYRRITDETPAPVVMGLAAHDLHTLLGQHIEQSKQLKENVHPALSQLYRALTDPAIQQFLETLDE